MKKVFPLAAVAAFGLTACNDNQASISGSISDMGANDTLLVFVSDFNTQTPIRVDTLALKDNHFELQLPDSAVLLQMTPKPTFPDGALRMVSSNPIIHFAGEKIQVEGKLDNLKITGSELYDDLQKFTEVQKVTDELNQINEQFSAFAQAGDQESMDSLRAIGMEKFESLVTAKLKGIKDHPKSIASAYYALQLTPEAGLEALQALDESVKKGAFAKNLEQVKAMYEQAIAQQKAAENIKPGMPAPNFQLKTIDGKEVSLATFKGKYLLIDFWGTWCGWCIKGIPEMKKYYNKYKSKIEFLGVDCRDSEEDWRKGVEKHKLPWVNVQDTKMEMLVDYGVSGFPTKVLLDKEGKIVEVFVGESPELYKKLDSLF